MYDMKALYEASSVENAVALRLEHPEAQIIAGGSDVLVQMREGKRAGAELISIYGLDELRGITIDADENIRIGSLTSFSHITRDPIIQQYINVLGEAVDMVGGPQIRNIGTIGGNTCNGVTSADSSSTLHAWDAIVELTGKNGVRRLPIHEFYIKAGKVDIRAEDGEIQTAILIPKESYDRCYGHYIKYAMRNAMDIATLGCSVNVRLSEDKKTIERARIAYGVAGPVPLRCASAEAAAQGKPLTEETLQGIAALMLDEYKPGMDAKGIAYRYTPAALKALVKKSEGGKFGARDLRRVIRKAVEDPAAERLIDGTLASGGTLVVDAGENGEIILK